MAFRTSNRTEYPPTYYAPPMNQPYHYQNKENNYNLKSPLQRFDEEVYQSPKYATSFYNKNKVFSGQKFSVQTQKILNNNPYVSEGFTMMNYSSSSSSSCESERKFKEELEEDRQKKEINPKYDNLFQEESLEHPLQPIQDMPVFSNSSQSIPSINVSDEKMNQINIFQKAFIVGLDKLKNKKKDADEINGFSPILPKKKEIIKKDMEVQVEEPFLKVEKKSNFYSQKSPQKPKENLLKTPLNPKNLQILGSSHKKALIFDKMDSGCKKEMSNFYSEKSPQKTKENLLKTPLNKKNLTIFEGNSQNKMGNLEKIDSGCKKNSSNKKDREEIKNCSLENLSKAIENFRKINEAFCQTYQSYNKKTTEKSELSMDRNIQNPNENTGSIRVANRINLIDKKSKLENGFQYIPENNFIREASGSKKNNFL